MLVGGSPIGTTSWASPGGFDVEGVASPFYAILSEGTARPLVLLFEATVYDPVADDDVSVTALWSNAGRPWRGVGDDTGAYPEIMTPAQVRSELFGGAPLSGDSGASGTRFGSINLRVDHQRGWTWTRYAFEGSAFTIKAGGIDDALSDFEVVQNGQISDVRWDRETLTLEVAEPDEPIRQPIQTNVYGGTGGLDGVAELMNQKKPLCYGPVFNESPRLIDPLNQVYQIHDGAVGSISVYDGGIPFSTAGPTDVADVYAWAPIAGEWVTDLANGVFRLGNAPAFALTFDAEGDAETALGGYVERLADVVERICVQRSTLAADDLDGLVGLDLAAPYRVGLYIADGQGTVDDALQALLAPIACYRILKPSGLLFFGQLALGGASAEIPAHRIKSGIRRTRGIRAIATHRVRYQRVGVVQNGDDLADGIDVVAPERAAFVSREWREVVYASGTGRRRARDVETQTALVDTAAATAEAQRHADLAELLPGIYELTMNRATFDILPGQTLKVTYPELGFEDGREMVCVAVNQNISAEEMGVTLWG